VNIFPTPEQIISRVIHNFPAGDNFVPCAKGNRNNRLYGGGENLNIRLKSLVKPAVI
jgi:hypothetical protein